MIKPIKLLSSTFFTSFLLSQSQSQEIKGWQSSWNSGEDYASTIYHNTSSDAYILVGTSYNNTDGVSRCILSEVKLQNGKNVQYLKEYVGDDELTACSSLSLHGAGGLILTGFMERSHHVKEVNGNFAVIDSSVDVGLPNAINGFVLNINGQTGVGTSGKMITDNQVTYPLLSMADNKNGGGIIVASLVTTDASLNRNYEYEEELPTGKVSHPNPNVLKYGEGSGMSIALQYLNYVKTTQSFRNGWTKVLSTVDEKDVRIHDMVLLGDKILLAGATAGHGTPFGDKDYSGSNDLDGFITSILIADGSVITPSKRVATPNNREDIINSICIDSKNHGIYVAGSTTGFMDPLLKRAERFNRFSAFLMKLDADSLETIWVKQVFTPASKTYAPQDVLGMGCAVDSEGNGVYITGIVHNDGNIEEEGRGNGLDDIFMAKFNPNGTELWRKQVGTDQNDVVAKGHKSMSFDNNGNVVVLGTTRGNMYRQKSSDLNDYTSDMFMIAFDKKDGTYPELIKPIHSTTGEMVASTSNVMTASTATTTETSSSKWKPAQIFGIVCLFTFLVLSLFLAAYTVGAQRTKKDYLKNQEDDHAEVQRYLEQLEQQEQAQAKSATVTSTIKHMFTKRSSSGVDALHLETNGGEAPSYDDFPEEIRFDDEPVANKSQFTVSDLGVTDDFMGGGSIATDNQSTDISKEQDSSAYDELLQGLHSISGLDDVVDTELKQVDDLKEKDEETANSEEYENGNNIHEPSAELI